MPEESFHPARCPHCGGDFEFAASVAGTPAACPHCASRLVLPALPGVAPTGSPAPQPAPSLDATRIARAFQGTLPRRTPTLAYRLTLLGVTALVLLLPLGYLALTAGLAAGLVAFALSWFRWVELFLGTQQFQAVAAVLYVFGLFLGGLVLFFLLKPLLAPSRPPAPTLALDPAHEPLLFAFLHMVCDALGAPHPARVIVDCRLNATARRLREGESSSHRGPVLTLGLPLVATLSLPQLAGVVAHEVAHFNQRAGMLATRILGGVIAWLERLAYGRDRWDDALETWTQGAPDWRTALVARCATAGVWFSRGLVKSLYYTGRAMSSALLRQMELEADRIQLQVAGASEFAATCLHLAQLRHVARAHYRDLRARWDARGNLPEDYPASLAEACAALPADRRDRFSTESDAEADSLFATHPTLPQRLQLAEGAGTPGIFRLDAPAHAVFRDFPALCREASQRHYRDVLKVPDASRA